MEKKRHAPPARAEFDSPVCEKCPQANRGELRGVRNQVLLVRGRMGNGGPGRKTWVVKVWLGNFSDGGGAWMRWATMGHDGPRRFGRRNSGETLESGQWP